MQVIEPEIARTTGAARPPSADRAPAARTILVLGASLASLVNLRAPLIAQLVGAGHRVIAAADGTGPHQEARLRALGAEYHPVPIARGGIRPDQDLQTYRAFLRLFRQHRPDILIAYTIKPVTWGVLAAAQTKVPRRFAIITGLGYSFGTGGLRVRLIGQVAQQLYRLSLKKVDAVFFQNPDDMALFEQRGLVRPDQAVLVNGSGVDLEQFRPAPLPATPVFLLISRFLVEKGLREFVAAARIIRRRHPEVRFVLIGAPDHANPSSIQPGELQGWIDEGAVECPGRLDDVRPAIAASSVFVLPTFYREGTPRTILEALAMGRPVVTTDTPGCRETVRPGVNGWLVPPRDPEALATALGRFIDEPESIARMGAASLEIAREKYDVEKVNAVMLTSMGLA